jgi:ABC-type transport system involved in multi-copper enzyme maturation permease subunit
MAIFAKPWREQVGDLVLLAGIGEAVALTYYVRFDFQWQQVLVIWLVALLPAFLVSRLGWLRLFGPVLFYEMVRQGRRARFILLRIVLAVGLALLLASMWISHAGNFAENQGLRRISVADGSVLAREYFELFALVQLAAVVLLTPAYVAGAIAEERHRHTLEFLLTSHLSNREIVLGKLASRLANLGLLLLTGLPILSILQFLGGIDPNLALASFAFAAITAVSIGGLSILCSVWCKKPRTAIALTYVLTLAFYGTQYFSRKEDPGYQTLASVFRGPGISVTGIDWLAYEIAPQNLGNIFSMVYALRHAAVSGDLSSQLTVLLLGFAGYHVLFAFVCTVMAVAFLRGGMWAGKYFSDVTVVLSDEEVSELPVPAIPVVEAGSVCAGMLVAPLPEQPRVMAKVLPSPELKRFGKIRPIGSDPLFWREVHCRKRTPAWRLIRNLFILTVIGIDFLVFFSLGNLLVELVATPGRGSRLAASLAGAGDELKKWIHLSNFVLCLPTLFWAAIRGSTTIAGERENQSLDTLLTTPLTTTSIMDSFCWSSIYSVRYLLLAILLNLCLAAGLGIMDLRVAILQIVIWPIYVVFAAMLGLYISTISTTPTTAALRTVVVLGVFLFAHWVLWKVFVDTMLAFGVGISFWNAADNSLLAPPFLPWAWLRENPDSSFRPVKVDWPWILVFSMTAVAAWSLATAILCGAARARLQHMRSGNTDLVERVRVLRRRRLRDA